MRGADVYSRMTALSNLNDRSYICRYIRFHDQLQTFRD